MSINSLECFDSVGLFDVLLSIFFYDFMPLSVAYVTVTNLTQAIPKVALTRLQMSLPWILIYSTFLSCVCIFFLFYYHGFGWGKGLGSWGGHM